MKRIALDSNIVDCFVDVPGLLERAEAAHRRGELVFVMTHVQRDEFEQTPNLERRRLLLAAFDRLPKVVLPTRGSVWGESKWAEAGWGDGAESGVRLGQIAGGGDHPMRDRLIGTTAAADADVLVTNDPKLLKRMTRAGAACAVWTPDQFKAHLPGLITA